MEGVSLEQLEAAVDAVIATYLRDVKEHYSAGGHNTLVDYVIVRWDDGSVYASTLDGAAPPEIAPARERAQRIRKLVTLWGDVIDVTTELTNGMILQLGLAEDNIEGITNTVAATATLYSNVTVAKSFSPTAVAPGGTSRTTTAFEPIRAPAPIVIGPRIFAPAPTTTPGIKVGWRLPLFHDVPPSVTP